MNTNTPTLKRLAEVRNLYSTGEARRIRIAANVSQAEFAKGVGASRAAVCLWESGARHPSTKLALRAWTLLDLLGVND